MRAALPCVLAVFALAGCNGSPATAPLPPFAIIGPWTGAQWRTIGPTLGGPLMTDAPNVCMGGAPACMNAVVAEMTRRINALGCGHLAPFAVMYREVSRDVRASVDRRRYEDPGYVAHLDAVFSTFYFHALDAWRSGRRAQVPQVWRMAFAGAQHHQLSTFGDMLLGMNAHISRDLPYVLADVGLRDARGRDATPDVTAVNADIQRSQQPMLAEIRRAYDPTTGPPRSLPKWIDPNHVGAIISAWRLEAIANARRLIAAHTAAQRLQVQTSIDDAAAVRSLLIWRATAYANPTRDTVARDTYCAAMSH